MSADGPLGPDTRRTLAAGRQSIGEVLVIARSYGRRLFVVFVVGLLGTIYAMQRWIWPILKADLLARGAEVVVITPFDVILLQAKLGIIVGLLMILPLLGYYAREPLKRRGHYPEEGVSSWKLWLIGLFSIVLFFGGSLYAYELFFPVMFDFLANNAISAGLAPTYSIVYWTQFILVLGLSFGVAAQLPLVMTALAYAEIVPYETFRDKWKYAVVAMFGFGALFSPPDPFTQLMWAGPLVVLYGFSLYLARIAVALRRGRDAVDLRGTVDARWTVLAGGARGRGGANVVVPRVRLPAPQSGVWLDPRVLPAGARRSRGLAPARTGVGHGARGRRHRADRRRPTVGLLRLAGARTDHGPAR